MHFGIKSAPKDVGGRLEHHGVSRRNFLKFCTAIAVTMGMGPAFAPEVARALTTRKASVVFA